MPNTIEPTSPPVMAEGPLAVIQEVDDSLALDGPVSTPPAENLDDGEILAAQLVRKRQAYAASLRKFHVLGSDEAKVGQKAMAIVRQNSAGSTSSDEPETPPIPLL